MKYKPSRDIPKFIKELKTFSPTTIRLKILTDRNKAVTPESITMWLGRHKEIRKKLSKDIIKTEISNEEVFESIFYNGTFYELSSVKKWIKDMKRRKIVSWKSDVSCLKQICRGYFPRRSVKQMPDWSLKHPDRLTQENVLEIVDYLELHGEDTSHIRLPARNFFMSCNKAFRDLSGAKSITFGKFADLFVERDKLTMILQWIRERNYEAYVFSLFMFKTGTRLTASLNAEIKEIRTIEGIKQISVYDKGRRSKHPKGKKWDKFIPDDLSDAMIPLIGDRKDGKIFLNMTSTISSELIKGAFREIIPDMAGHISMPNHFWRHMFAQHMLRATGWKYGIVANLGGWTVKALEESYGKPPLAQVQEWGLEYIPQI